MIIYKDKDHNTDIDHFDKKRTELLQGKKSPVNSKKDLINFVQALLLLLLVIQKLIHCQLKEI